ncbi:MAG: DNA -binding domain-containing protein [Tsuneonella suprasediminis]
MTIPPFDECPPQAPNVTSYDERHFVTYLRLLEAAKERADWREVALILFGLDPTTEPDRARTVHDSHLARARWMTRAGYRDLLGQRPQ